MLLTAEVVTDWIKQFPAGSVLQETWATSRVVVSTGIVSQRRLPGSISFILKVNTIESLMARFGWIAKLTYLIPPMDVLLEIPVGPL